MEELREEIESKNVHTFLYYDHALPPVSSCVLRFRESGKFASISVVDA